MYILQTNNSNCLFRIADILPQVVEEYNNKKCQFYEDSDNTAIKKYIELTSSNVKFNYSIPIVEMDEELVNLMKSKNLTPKDFELVSVTFL